MKETSQQIEADRLYRNLHVSPCFHGTVNATQADQIMNNGDFIFCNGRGRRIKCDQISPDRFNVYTVEA